MAVTLDRIPAQVQGGGHVDLGNEQVVARLKHTEVAEVPGRMRVVLALAAPVRIDLHEATAPGARIVPVPSQWITPRFTPGRLVQALQQLERPADFAGHSDRFRAQWRERQRGQRCCGGRWKGGRRGGRRRGGGWCNGCGWGWGAGWFGSFSKGYSAPG